ncbi:3'(2'),5'-bisphosphate nucleotidase CysQ [Candidatus Entotheonellaceae bacterium PAL068K]
MAHRNREVHKTMQIDRHVLREAEAVSVEAVRQAGNVLLDYFRAPLQVEFKEKGQQSPVTEADRQSEEFLRTALGRAFPDHGIIGEEAEDVVNAGADYVWFLDPLDGTTNFTAGLPAFAISMGLCLRGRPVLGVIAIPWEGPNGTIFRAYQGSGAYCNDAPIQAAPAELPAGIRLASMPFWALWQYRVRRQAHLQDTNVRAHGSIAYELVYAACGAFQYSIISGARLWDMIAGVVLVQESGGSTLFSNGTARRWSAWEPFLQRVLSHPFGQDTSALRQLHINMLVGNSQIVQQRAGQIAVRRPSLVGKARRRLQKSLKRFQWTTAGRTDSSDQSAAPPQA